MAPTDREPEIGAGLEVDTHGGDPEGVYPEARIEGVVEGEAYGDRACMWIRPQEGDAREGEQVLLVWPEGYSAIDNPLRVLDEDGESVLTSGEEAAVGGAMSQQERECGGRTGPAWNSAPLEPR